MVNGENRDESNTGYGAYIGARRVAWDLDEAATIARAVEAIKRQQTKNRFVPCAAIFDQAQILIVAFVTDDANGITVHRRNATNEIDYQIMTDKLAQ